MNIINADRPFGRGLDGIRSTYCLMIHARYIILLLLYTSTATVTACIYNMYTHSPFVFIPPRRPEFITHTTAI
jgi:hypothetical protein